MRATWCSPSAGRSPIGGLARSASLGIMTSVDRWYTTPTPRIPLKEPGSMEASSLTTGSAHVTTATRLALGSTFLDASCRWNPHLDSLRMCFTSMPLGPMTYPALTLGTTMRRQERTVSILGGIPKTSRVSASVSSGVRLDSLSGSMPVAFLNSAFKGSANVSQWAFAAAAFAAASSAGASPDSTLTASSAF